MSIIYAMSRYAIPLLVLLATAAPGAAQDRRMDRPAGATDLEGWVELALERNLALRAAEAVNATFRAGADDALSGLLPSVRLNARYSVADGGRIIPIPVGDLVNPIYGALETLPQFAPGTFPSVANDEVPFFLDRELDARIELRQSVFRPEAWAGSRAANAREAAADEDLSVARAAVRREVEAAWYALRSAEQGVAILESALVVVDEALRTAEVRADAEEITLDEVLRLRAERLDVVQQGTEARATFATARAAFNRLLDRPLDAPVDTPAGVNEGTVAAAFAHVGIREAEVRDRLEETRTRLEARARRVRPELRSLGHGVDAASAGVDAAAARWLPTLDLAVDLGAQGRDFALEQGGPFVLASAVVSWDLWTSGRRSARQEQAELELRRLELLRADAELGVRLEVRTALDEVHLALVSRDVAEQRVAAATEAFRLTERRYREGLALPVTLLDARDARTRAELDLNTVQFRLLDRLSALARAVAAETDR
jgi:outer membrane protein TolC